MKWFRLLSEEGFAGLKTGASVRRPIRGVFREDHKAYRSKKTVIELVKEYPGAWEEVSSKGLW